ncbi:MAG: O-antigen ligase family protein [Clostridiales bacterium]|nr:O-antigen ligase family protein [Clostridiales bacterium]
MQKVETKNLKEKAWSVLLQARALLGGVPFAFFETVASLIIVFTMQEVAGAVLFVALIALKLVVCDDILPTTLPFLLLSTFLTNCYDSYNTFIVYLPVAPIVAMCGIFHFVVYHKPFRFGDSAYGIIVVSIAVTLGGAGAFGLWDYLRGAYYIFGLGFGMLIAYLLMKSQFSVRQNYDLKERFALIMTLMGTLCSAMVITGYVRRWMGWWTGPYAIGFSRNNISTLLMFAMPFPMFLGIKRKWVTAFTAVFFGIICVTTSRGGLIFGAIEFLVCCVIWIVTGGTHKKRRAWICAGALFVILLCCGVVIWQVVTGRLLADGKLTGDARYTMLFEAFENFRQSPWLGTGILDDSIAYGEFKKQGAMTWYHMWVPQVIGSMGVLGVIAYALQFFIRAKLVFTRKSPWSICLGISYLGLFLMSQVNPGEFCPLPFLLLATLLFIFQERRLEEDSLPFLKTFSSQKTLLDVSLEQDGYANW